MDYEQLYYSTYSNEDLVRIINDDSQLDGFRRRCEQEYINRLNR